MICHGPMTAELRGENGKLVTVLVCKTCLAVEPVPQSSRRDIDEFRGRVARMMEDGSD